VQPIRPDELLATVQAPLRKSELRVTAGK
jgi:DNA-binding response OmpR family regulator